MKTNRTFSIAGKGGAGKTLIAVNLSIALSQLGATVLLVDANIASPSVLWHFGTTQLPHAIQHVLRNQVPIEKAVYQHPSGLMILLASIAHEDMHVSLSKLLEKISGFPSHITIIDLPAGLSEETHEICSKTETILVTTPDLPTVTDSLRIARSCKLRGVVVNKSTWEYGMSSKNIEAFLNSRVLATLEEDSRVLHALHVGKPLLRIHPESGVSKQLQTLAKRILR